MKLIALSLLFASATFSMAQTPENYRPAVYPQQQTTAGTAVLDVNENEGTYLFHNDVLDAKFVKVGNTLKFGGSQTMNLNAGSEIFIVKFGNGSDVVPASEMTLAKVEEKPLTANPSAIKGVEHFGGKALEATFTYQYKSVANAQEMATVTVVWRAELRDGSHYIKTDLTLTSDKDVKMYAIIPMQYTVDAITAGTAPAVSGNTRGSVLISDKIFAGLETPTGYNTAGTENDLDGAFAYSAWNASYFDWTPDELPAGITDAHYNTTNIVGKRGYLKFKEAGPCDVTFTYSEGTHKLNIAGVDLVDPATGKVVASDYHNGRTGGSHADNKYTLDVPAEGIYLVRYYISLLAWSEGYKDESITSKGNITYSTKVKTVTVVHDLDPVAPAASAARKAPAQRAAATVEEGRVVFEDDATHSLTYGNVNATNFPKTGDDYVPARIKELGYSAANVRAMELPVRIDEAGGDLKFTFKYKSGSHRIDIVGVDLIDNDHEDNNVRDDYHFGYAGSDLVDNVYTLRDLTAGNFTVRIFVTTANNNTITNGTLEMAYGVEEVLHLPAAAVVPIQGLWMRDTNLLAYTEGSTAKDTKWNVSAVVGVVNKDHKRRSVLAYSERERAVPWRAYPIYNSWYEININHNNFEDPTQNMNVTDCANIVNAWKEKLYDKYGVGIKSFVWDDGWDEYGTWNHHGSFPNGFKEPGQAAAAMNSGNGAWLGPVGGYGKSGEYRRGYWNTNNRGGMRLSNPAYYETFKNSIVRLVDTEPKRDGYEFNYFKFDGISDLFSATGPKDNATGNEDAEGIITCERYVRENVKEDVFFNTTVGTWASPFWFHFTDAVWRQEKDYGETGVGTSREKWITYRDRLIHQNFVTNAPYCPINSLMFHGFIFHQGDGVSSNFDYAGALRELRCAFACGSGQVELYADHELLSSTRSDANDPATAGALWKDLADCIKWQEANADVLPDAHWVGGNPWTGGKAEIYGWAAWNGQKAVLTLRNGATQQQTYTTTLRAALDIPADYTGTVVLSPAFDDQKGALLSITGVEEGSEISVDTPLTFTLPGSTVYVFDGVNPLYTPETSVPPLTGYELPIPNGVYEIQNAESVQNRGYLVDCSTNTDGPSLAECGLTPHNTKHPEARNGETTSSYWYVHEKGGKYYIVSLSALQSDATPRFITPNGSANRTQYVSAATPLQVKEVTKNDWTFTDDGKSYKYMLIADGINGTRVVSASCSYTTADGCVRTDTNTQDGGAPWKFIRSNVSLTEKQLAIRAAAIRLIEADANIVRLTEFVDKAPSGETTISDINVVSDVILQK